VIQGYVHVHSWSLFFGGSRCCESMGDRFFIGDSGLFKDCSRCRFVDSRFSGVAEGVNRCWYKHFPHKEGVLAFGFL
jgi:hypothetical protein